MDSRELLKFKPLFDEYIAQGPRPLSCYHFSSIFAWSGHFSFSFEIIHERLCVFAHQGKDRFLYMPPLGGEWDKTVMAAVFNAMGKSSIARIENISQNQLPAISAQDYNVFHKANEYVYARKDLAALAGQAYKSQRHDGHVFKHRYADAHMRPFTPSDLIPCQALYQQWADHRRRHHTDDIYVQMLDENKAVHALLMQYAGALGLVGRVLVAGDQLIGYTFGYPLDEQTFCVLLEITDLTSTGSAAYIFQQFCNDPGVLGFDWINTMDDCGMPNVARTKMAYHPQHILPVYSIKEVS